jgi:hypothetical protein
MNLKYKMKFLQGDAGGGAGGGESGGGGGESIPSSGGEISRGDAAFEPVTKQTTGDQPLPGAKAKPAEHVEGVPDEVPPVQPSSFDASKFAKEFGDTLSTTLKPILEKAGPQEPPMTPEEARRILNIWEPDEQWYARYDNLDTRTEAVNEMRDGLIRQADTLAQFRMQEMVDALRNEVMPHLTQSTQAANQAREERFTGQYPQLKEPALNPLIKAVAQDFVDRGQTFQTEAELFKALAGGVEAVLKVNNPDFKLETANGSGQQTQQGRSGRSLPVSTPGGGGGTGRREGGGKQDKPRGMAIFDKL